MAYKTTLKSNLYKGSNGYIYYRKMINGTNVQIPAGTKDHKIANRIRSQLEYKAINSYYNPDTGYRFVKFPKLVKMYLSYADHPWSEATRSVTTYMLYNFLKKGIPKNLAKSTVNTYKSKINSVILWGQRRSIDTNKKLYTGNLENEARLRVFSITEMVTILNSIEDEEFRKFVTFAYYTGCRRGELENIIHDTVQSGYMEVRGKGGSRIVKVNEQAKKIYQEANTPWSYTLDYMTKHFKKELRRLKIRNGRFQDLRRTFGSNLIKNGVSIYAVKELLGHKRLSTTERHYAHLLIPDIKEFSL